MLNVIFWILAVLGALSTCFAVPALKLWWLLPLVVGNYLGLVVLLFVIITLVWLFLPKKGTVKKPIPLCRFMICYVMDWLMHALGIRVAWKKRELLPEEPCVIVSNHLSDFDPMILLSLSKKRKIVYISKESNFRLPLAGAYIRGAGFLPIDRENPLRAMRTLGDAGEKMKAYGVDVGVYPEGTRSKTGKLLRFKKGAFVLAQRAEAPVAIMVTRGTEKIGKNLKRLRPTKVEMEILEILDREKVLAMTTEDMALYARSVIAKALGQELPGAE